MVNFWWLATEAAEASHGGFGLNFDLLETNLINLAIIIGVLFYFGRGILGKSLSARKEEIETAITEAEKRQKDAAAALADQQQKLAQAQAEAERIRSQAEVTAKSAREAILAQLETDLQRMQETAAQDVNVEREKALLELRRKVAAMALQRTQEQLPSRLNEDLQQQIINRSITLLGGNG